jgi:hypothetical protein
VDKAGGNLKTPLAECEGCRAALLAESVSKIYSDPALDNRSWTTSTTEAANEVAGSVVVFDFAILQEGSYNPHHRPLRFESRRRLK